jgi:hypothetical protein
LLPDRASPQGKKELLQILYSNCHFDGEKLHIDLRKLYNLILNCASEDKSQAVTETEEVGISQDWWR